MSLNERKKTRESKPWPWSCPRWTITITTPEAGGFVATIDTKGIDFDLLECLHDYGLMVYDYGRKDRANGAAALPMSEFRRMRPRLEAELPYEFAEALIKAQ